MIVEIARFQLLPDVDVSEFLSVHQDFHLNWVMKQPGFVNRTTYKDEQGIWQDVLHWETLEFAQQASEKLMKNPDAIPWMQMMDPESVDMYHGDIMKKF